MECPEGFHRWICKLFGPAKCGKCGKTYSDEDYAYDKEHGTE
jgi:hypothetical protein